MNGRLSRRAETSDFTYAIDEEGDLYRTEEGDDSSSYRGVTHEPLYRNDRETGLYTRTERAGYSRTEARGGPLSVVVALILLPVLIVVIVGTVWMLTRFFAVFAPEWAIFPLVFVTGVVLVGAAIASVARLQEWRRYR